MDLAGKVINNTYIIKSLLEETDFIQRWEAKAIFSPNSFYLDFIKGKKESEKLLKNNYILSKKLVALQEIRNPYILKTIEYGEYNNHFFSAQQKVAGKSLLEVCNNGTVFSENTVLRIMNHLGQCLIDFERKRLSHNLLSISSIWIPKNVDNMGTVYIGDAFLYYLLFFSEKTIKSHYDHPNPYIYYNFYSAKEYRSDIINDFYSFGAIFYKLISGNHLYITNSYEELIDKQKIKNIDFSMISNTGIKDFLIKLLCNNLQYIYQ